MFINSAATLSRVLKPLLRWHSVPSDICCFQLAVLEKLEASIIGLGKIHGYSKRPVTILNDAKMRGDNRMSDWNKAIIEEFRANKGKVGGHFEGANLLLLHTTGAKSGLERVNPMVYFMDDDRYVVIASKAGADTHPDWYHNLLAHPEVSVEVGTERFPAIAAVPSEPERTKLYEKMESINPGFAEYKHKTSRIIPVITLTRKI